MLTSFIKASEYGPKRKFWLLLNNTMKMLEDARKGVSQYNSQNIQDEIVWGG